MDFEPVIVTKGSVRVIFRNAMKKNCIENLFKAQKEPALSEGDGFSIHLIFDGKNRKSTTRTDIYIYNFKSVQRFNILECLSDDARSKKESIKIPPVLRFGAIMNE